MVLYVLYACTFNGMCIEEGICLSCVTYVDLTVFAFTHMFVLTIFKQLIGSVLQ